MGIIIVDTSNTFDTIPIVDAALPIYPGGPTVKLSVPCFLTTYEMAGVLQEGAMHAMFLMKDQPPGLGAGKYIGFAVCERQESRRSMSPGISCVCVCVRACGREVEACLHFKVAQVSRWARLPPLTRTHTHARANTHTHTHRRANVPTAQQQLTVGRRGWRQSTLTRSWASS